MATKADGLWASMTVNGLTDRRTACNAQCDPVKKMKLRFGWENTKSCNSVSKHKFLYNV